MERAEVGIMEARPRSGWPRLKPGLVIPVCVALTVICWASAFPAIKVSLAGFPPFELALLRFGITAALLGVAALFWRIRLPEAGDIGKFFLAGMLGVAGYHSALNKGQTMVSAGSASFVVNTVPIFTTIMASVFLGEKFRLRGFFGLLLSFSGVLLIAAGEGKGLTLNAGVGFILLAALFQTAYFILQKPLLRKYTVFEVVCYSMWAGILGLLIFTPGLIRSLATASQTATWSAVYLAVFPGAIAFLTWSKLLAMMPASRASSFLYLVPVTATLIAWLLLGEVPKLFSLLGGGLALCGVVLVNAKSSPH